MNVCCIGKLEDAQSVLKEAIATLEKSATAKQEFCQVCITWRMLLLLQFVYERLINYNYIWITEELL